MKMFYKAVVEKKKQLLNKLEAKTLEEITPKETILAILLSEGYVVYIPQNFDLQLFIQEIKDFLHSEFKFETQTTQHDSSLYQISYVKSNLIKNKLGLSERFSLFVMQNDYEILLHIRKGTDNESTWISGLKSMFSRSEEDELIDFTEAYVLKLLQAQTDEEVIFDKSALIDEVSVNFKLWYLSVADKGENLLAKLRISEIKTLPMLLPQDAVTNMFFILTTKNFYIVGFDRQNEAVFFESPDTEIVRSKGILRNTLEAGEHKWTTKRTNAKLFDEAIDIGKHTEHERLIACARFNYLNEHIEVAKKLLNAYKLRSNSLLADLLEKYIEIKEQNTDFRSAEVTLRSLSAQPELLKQIPKIVTDWEFEPSDIAALAELIARLAENKTQKIAIADFYTQMRELFVKEAQDAISVQLFDIRYAVFLIETDQINPAVKLLKENRNDCPDESVANLVTWAKTAPGGTQTGTLLRVRIAETLTKAGFETEKNIESLTLMQPLNQQRLKNLSELKSAKNSLKAGQLHNILTTEAAHPPIQPPEFAETISASLDKNLLTHPFLRKNGAFSDIPKWVSKMKQADNSDLKTFGTIISESNHNQVFTIVNKLKKYFNMPDIEAYIAGGTKGNQIVGYESVPSFIMIGEQFVNPTSPLMLSEQELTAAIASELSLIKHNFHRITSSEHWQNAADNDTLFIDNLCAEFHPASLPDHIAENINRHLDFQNAVNSERTANSSGDIFGCVQAVAKFYANTTTQSKTDLVYYKMLAVMRLLTANADRYALIFTNDISVVMASVLKSVRGYNSVLAEYQQNTLAEILDKADSKGQFLRQQLALRIAELFRFYLSDEYDKILSELKFLGK